VAHPSLSIQAKVAHRGAVREGGLSLNNSAKSNPPQSPMRVFSEALQQFRKALRLD
jgi:hypothetical protein